jgi:hypothetical protein
VVAINIDAQLSWAAERIVIFAARRVGDPELARRYEEEWLAGVQRTPGGVLKLVVAFSILVRAPVPLRVLLSLDRWTIVVHRPRILLMLAMASSAAMAEDVVFGLGHGVAHDVLALLPVWQTYFLVAFGLGVILGAFIGAKKWGSRSLSEWSHRAASFQLMLAASVIVFAAVAAKWLCLMASMMAGAATMATVLTTLRVIYRASGPKHTGHMTVLWLVVFASSQAEGLITGLWLGTNSRVLVAGVLLAGPAFCIAVLELFLAPPARNRLRSWIRNMSVKSTRAGVVP